MWVLIVISTIWDHGAHEHIYNVTPMVNEARCEQIAQAINDNEKAQTQDSKAIASCKLNNGKGKIILSK
jgi:hypothetical protein